MTLEIGARLGHYRIIGLLGRGGMADVYRAEDERLGREVALKAVPPEFARDADRVERFEREVRAAARLTHPNIVTVYEFGQGAGQHFYTMALMPGGDLKARIRAHPDGMPPEEARAVAAAMARALDYAHQQGFVHRDVKPENILFGEDGAPQLTDFGIARAMSSGARMTATGMSIGSPHYMSPEQARGKEVDGRSDLYSLGVVLYEMLTGRAPFEAAETFAVAYAHINDPVPQLPPTLADWQPVMDRLLAKSPEDRYSTAAEVAEILVPGSQPRPSATRVMTPGRGAGAPAPKSEPSTRLAAASPQQKRLLAVAGGALLALVAVGLGYVALQGGDGVERETPSGGGSGPIETAPVQPEPSLNATNPFSVDDPDAANGFDAGDGEETASGDGEADAEAGAPVPEPVLVAETTPPGAEVLAEQETVFWQSIVNSTNQAMFETYLEQFPNGVFRALAEARLAELGAPGGDGVADGGVPASTAADPAPRAGETQVFDGMEFVWVPAGEFLMGSTSAEAYDNEQPVRTVRIGEGFWLGKYEVTQAEWERVMGSNPSGFDECGARCPVEQVSWNDAREFIERLNAGVGGDRYRMPTEAEWEYAARAGTTGDRYGNVDAIGWHRGNSRGGTDPVGQKGPNGWGLHDMLGNVAESVDDCWHDSYGGAPADGTARTSGGNCSRRVVRGGSWFHLPRAMRAAYRYWNDDGIRDDLVGFRVARTPD